MWGIDCKKRAISLARKSIATLEASNEQYVRCAGPCTLRQHNVFLPADFLTVSLTACVHAGGASCGCGALSDDMVPWHALLQAHNAMCPLAESLQP